MRTLVHAFSLAVALAAVAFDPAQASAQQASISMRADPTRIAVGQTLRLIVQVDVTGGEAPEPELPDLSAFDIVQRQVSRPMTFSWGHGGTQRMMQSSLQYLFALRARSPGRFALDAPRVRVGNRTVVGNPLTIEVTGDANANAPQQQPLPQPQPQNGAPPPANQPPTGVLDGATVDGQAFLRTVVDRSEAVIGEQVTLTLYLYTRVALRDAPTITREATTDGFWVHDLLPPQRQLEGVVQRVGDVPYRVYTLRRLAAFPLREGTLTIGAPSANIPIGGVFDLFNGQQPADLQRTGVPLAVRVGPLPAEGRPTGEVHVGALALTAAIDRTQVPTGDAVTLTVRATGTGRLTGLRLELLPIDGMRVRAPQTRDEVSSPGDLVGGVRTFEWLIVPERPGTFTIPPLRVATFDPRTRRYGLAASEALTLVAAGNAIATVPTTPEAHEEPGIVELERLGPVRTESALSRATSRLVDAAYYPWLLAIGPLAWLAMLGVGFARRRAARPEGSAQRAGREVKKRLAAAEAALEKNAPRDFYAALALALKSVIEGRLGESVGSLTHPQLRRRLAERGMGDEQAKRVVEELEGIELVRFSTSGADAAEMRAALGRARERIAELDRFQPTPLEDA